VSDNNNAPIPYTLENQGQYLRIKIGDPQIQVTGQKTYHILYTVKGALNYFPDHDELYWNATANAWPVAITKATAHVALPRAVGAPDTQLACFSGATNSQESNCTAVEITPGTFEFKTTSSLPAEQGLTIVVGWPKGIVTEQAPPTTIEKFGVWPFIIAGIFYGLIPIIFFAILLWYWWKKGRDIKLKKTIIAQYEPPDKLRPAEVALILNQKITARDITATIIDLAVRKYIKIEEIEDKVLLWNKKDWRLHRLKDYQNDPELNDYEQYLLQHLFGSHSSRKLSDLQNKFAPHLAKITEKINISLTEKKYFASRPDKLRQKWLLAGMLLIFGSMFLIAIFSWLVPTLIACGVQLVIFSFFMPKLTPQGAEARWVIEGFKLYIKTAEQHRAEFYEKAQIFETCLPYAIIFDLVDNWAKAFQDIYTTQPEWYAGSSPMATFSVIAFSSSLNHSLNSFAGTLGATASHGGSGFSGGFSGGGGGGGGGGSW